MNNGISRTARIAGGGTSGAGDRMIGLMAITANLCVWAVLVPAQTAMAF